MPLKSLLLTLLLATSKLLAEPSEIDIVGDILKPTGMPLVTFYHQMRESVFFNIKTPNDNFFTKIGDFFLAPSHYLFAGKTVSFSDNSSLNYVITPRFNYEEGCLAKTFGSLLAFPLSEPLGALFKGLSYLSPQTRAQHDKIYKALHTPFVSSYLDTYRQNGITTFHCSDFIPCQEHKRPSCPTKKQQLELSAFKEITALFDAHDIIYWIDCGTCLGAYRYGGVIPWDIDIDIAIFLPDHENVKRLLSTMDPTKYQIQDWSSYSKPQTFLKLYVKETKNYIDIYHYQLNPTDNTLFYFYSYEDSPFPDSWKKAERKCTKPVKIDDVFPLKRALFDGLEVWAPHNVVTFLQSKYGQNLDPSMLWDDTTSSYIKVLDHPYWRD